MVRAGKLIIKAALHQGWVDRLISRIRGRRGRGFDMGRRKGGMVWLYVYLRFLCMFTMYWISTFYVISTLVWKVSTKLPHSHACTSKFHRKKTSIYIQLFDSIRDGFKSRLWFLQLWFTPFACPSHFYPQAPHENWPVACTFAFSSLILVWKSSYTIQSITCKSHLFLSDSPCNSI